MGTWNTSINGNDDFNQVYDMFKELYFEHSGKEWLYSVPDIKKKMTESFSFQLDDADLADEFWFAQAKAFWDFGIDDKSAYEKVKQIVGSGSNLDSWRRLDGTDQDIKKRKKVLETFLDKISMPNQRPVKRGRLIKINPPFETGDILSFNDEQKNYYAGVVSGTAVDARGICVVHLLNYKSIAKPGQKDLLELSLMAHPEEPPEFHRDAWANAIHTNVHGFLVIAKGLAKAKTKFEKIGRMEFHEFGFFKDGFSSYVDMSGYSWDVLPAYAALNYKASANRQLLKYYTTSIAIEKKEIDETIELFRDGNKVTLAGLDFDPRDIFVWLTVNEDKKKKKTEFRLSFALNGYHERNTYLINNIFSRLFNGWINSKGFKLDSYYLSFNAYEEVDEKYRSYYKTISQTIKEIEAKIKVV